MKFDLFYADPPWQYKNAISNGAANNHYSTMKIEQLKTLDVESIAAENSVLVMWYTGNFVREAMDLAEAWGFNIKTNLGFVWVKLNKNANTRRNMHKCLAQELNIESKMNGGNYTRANAELALIATRGKGLERHSRSVKQVITTLYEAHSKKPEEARTRLETLYGGNINRLEMFAREQIEGWHVFGNEVENSIEIKFKQEVCE